MSLAIWRIFNHGFVSWAVSQSGESAHLSFANRGRRTHPESSEIPSYAPRPVRCRWLTTVRLPSDLAELITNLFDTMDAAYGVGLLAANQIGVSKRVFVYDRAEDRGKTTAAAGVIVNPVLETSDAPRRCWTRRTTTKACLSVPGESLPYRPCRLGAGDGLDADGTPITLEGSGLFARMLQHETGHLTGCCT